MKNLIAHLKGLYWYFSYSNRIIIPTIREGWGLLWTIANSWKDGYPEDIQFGMCLAVSYEEAKKPDAMKEVVDVVNYHYERQCQFLGCYGYLPKGDKRIIEWGPDDLCSYANIGWKATFEWRPVC
jgi:hypothetical protein